VSAGLTTIKKTYFRTLYWQIAVTLAIALLSAWMLNISAFVSAVLGGGAVVVGGYAGMIYSLREGKTPGDALIILLKAEVIKVVIIAMVLFFAFKFFQGLVALPLIGGLACAALLSGVSLQARQS